jgi:hypothetical protein
MVLTDSRTALVSASAVLAGTVLRMATEKGRNYRHIIPLPKRLGSDALAATVLVIDKEYTSGMSAPDRFSSGHNGGSIRKRYCGRPKTFGSCSCS